MRLSDLLTPESVALIQSRYPSAKGEPRVHRVARGTFGVTLTINHGEPRIRGGAPRGLMSSMVRACDVARTYGVKSRV